MRKALLASLALGCSIFGFAAEAPPRPPLPAVLAQARVEPAAVETIYNEAILRDGTVDPTVEQLSTYAKDETQSRLSRTNALLVASHLQWRFGRLPAAMEVIDRAIAIEASGTLTLHKARILEASGKLPEARQWYERSLTLVTDPEEKEDVSMRLTFLVTNPQNVEALVKLAKTRDREFRNRAAVALAILDHPAEAADLFEVFGEGAQRQRQHLRLAQWAVQANQAKKAQDEAWEAVQGATLSRDVRYSLSVLVEAHELDESWERLLAKFAAEPNLSADAKAARVDVLHRLKRYDEAIAFIEGDRSQGMSPEGQRRLLRMYSEAGRHEALVTEFRKLIAKEPAEVAWPRGLGEYFLEQGRRDEAAKLWRDFTQNNSAPEVLLDGAGVMAQHGLDELALAAADKCLAVNPDSATYVQWFRYEHYLKRGQIAKVEEVLRQLEKELPADSPQRPNVADGYERIKNPKGAVAIWEELAKREGGIGSEESMHLAWLYDTTGDRDKALALWKKIWEGEVSETRRKLVEDRLLLLAAEAGTVGDLAISLEEKIANGTAAPKDTALLVRIYTDASDPASAIEVIQESFRRREQTAAVEIASLQEQARVYQALNRHGAFIAVTEKLLKLDPANSVEYLQSLILNYVERGGKQDVELLQRRLTDLRQRSVAAGDEFEAGVLVMAGFKDKGIDSYRRALARNPGSSDNYLLLADLLKQGGHMDQGTAILQYFAEIAPGDDGFMVAIDGILNLKPAADSAVLRWAQRRVLERITRHADKFYLYDLSAELAEESRDMKTYLSSLENSLVEAGPRRSTVLRELIGATEERSPGSSSAGGLVDLRRNLSYSRKLVAMGEDMPPEVYLNLGRTFLRMDNPGEALNAFNLAIDRTDRLSLVEESADRFESAGYSSEATVLYEKALTADTSNVGVMAKLAAMRSRSGAIDLANGMYLRALLRVIDQQPIETEPPAAGARSVRQQDDGFTFLFKRYYSIMQSGLLFTLAPDVPGETAPPPQFAAIEAAFDQVLQDVLQRAAGKPLKPLAAYPRLSVLAKLARMSAMHSGRYSLADRLDLKLLKHFGGDVRTVTELVTQRLAWGLRSSADKLRTAEGVSPKTQSDLAPRTNTTVALAPMTDLAAAARQALSQKNYELAADSAIAAGDAGLTDSIYQEWLNFNRASPAARAAAARSAVAAGGGAASLVLSGAAASSVVVSVSGGVMVLSQGGAAAAGNLGQLADHARRKMTPERFAALSKQIVALAAENPEVARDLINNRSSGVVQLSGGTAEKSRLFSLEEAAGQKLFTEEQLATAVAAIDARQLMTIDMDYVMGRLPAAARGPLFLRQLQGYPPTSFSSQFISSLALLLSKPVDPDSSAKILTELKDRIQKYTKQFPTAIRSVASSFTALLPSLAKSLDRANVGFLADLDRHLSETYPDAFSKGVFAALVQPVEGEGAMPLQSIVDSVLRDIAQIQFPPDYPVSSMAQYIRRNFTPFTDQIFPQRKAELLALLEKRSQEPGQNASTFFAMISAVYQSDPAGDPRDVVTWLEGIRQRQPDHRLALESLLPLYRQSGESDKERETLERLITIAPENDTYRQRLSGMWRALDHPENALRALGGRARVSAAVRDSTTSAGAQLTYASLGAAQVGKMLGQLSKPDAGPEAQGALRGLLQMLPAPGIQPYEYYRNGNPVIELSSLFALSAEAAAPRSSLAAAPEATSSLLRAIESDESPAGGSGQPARFLEQVATHPFAIPELEAAMRTLDPSLPDTDEQYLFYPLMAHAYASTGRMPADFKRLTDAIQAGTAGKKELMLWLELVIRQPAETMRELLPVAEKTFLAGGAPSDYQRIQMARLYAKAGRPDLAVGIYSVSAISALGSSNSLVLRSSRSDTPSLFSVGGLCNDAEKYLDRESLGTFFARLAQIGKPSGGQAYEMWYQRFVLMLTERTLKAGGSTQGLQGFVTTFDPTKARREDLARYAQMQSRALPVDQALPALRSALRKGAETSQPSVSSTAELYLSRYAQSLGFRYVNSGLSSSGAEPSAVLNFKALFPARADAWPNAREWTVRAAQAVPGWFTAADVDQDIALQVLALLALREQQMGLPESAATAKELSRLVGQVDRISGPTAVFVVAVADRVKTPIDLAVLRKLVSDRRLDVRQLAGVVHRTAEIAGAAAAISLGESALQYTENDDLLKELESLAQQSGNESQLGRFREIRQQAASARATLESTKNPATGTRVSSLN